LTTGHERDTETDLDYRGARFYDSDVVRFLSLDPLAAKYAAWSAYNYVLGNPVMFTDPTGQESENANDWYKDKDGVNRYSPNVKSQQNLSEGQKYIGETIKEGSTEYRKDGSILFKNETEAYKRMDKEAKLDGTGERKLHETLGVIMSNGVLLLPDYKNDGLTSEVEKYEYKFNSNGEFYDPITASNKNLLGTIHTHPVKRNPR
jgi:RHS repeat-associated protein